MRLFMTRCDSFFNMANHNPPIISISTYTMGDAPKDTARNIIDTKEFTVNIIAEPFVEAANFTSVEAPAEADEWIGSGLTREPSVGNLVLPSVLRLKRDLDHRQTASRTRKCLQHGMRSKSQQPARSSTHWIH
jgi:hypothetical protein